MGQQARREENLIARSLRDFGRNVATGFVGVNDWRQDAVDLVEDIRVDLVDWAVENAKGLIIAFCLLFWIGLTIWFIQRITGEVDGGHIVASLIFAAITSAVAGIPIAVLSLLLLFLGSLLFKVVTPLVFFLPVL